jgi:hypothetical protein
MIIAKPSLTSAEMDVIFESISYDTQPFTVMTAISGTLLSIVSQS